MHISISKDELEELYVHQKLNTYQIAEKLNCSQATIWKKLIKYAIPRRTPHELTSNIPSKDELFHLYINKKLSTWKIEKEYGYSRGTIHRKLKEYGIKTRDLATANIKYEKLDFSGNLIEKAYIIGFRLGDLRVRKYYKNSKTICVGCSSTIPEQITLIKQLFSEYGHVWINKSGN